MRPKQLAKAIRQSLAINVPLMIWGSPGTGKSKIVRQTVESEDYFMADLRLATMDTVDLRGYPDKQADRARWLKPAFFPDGSRKTCLFMDEITQCNSEIQGASLQMVYDFCLGEHPLPADTRILMAGNRTSDRTGANKMISALKNRVIHVHAESNYEDWLEYASGAGFWASVIGYIHLAPQHLNTFDPTKDQEAFATPRSWEMVSKLENADPSVFLEMVGGLIGREIAPAFVAFDRLRTQLDIEEILKNPDVAELPKKADLRYALMVGVGERVKKNLSKYVEAAATLALRFDALGAMEFTIACIRNFQCANNGFQLQAINKVPEFSTWLLKNRDYINSAYTGGKA